MKTYRSSIVGTTTDLTIIWNDDADKCDLMHMLKDAIGEICKQNGCTDCQIIDVPMDEEATEC